MLLGFATSCNKRKSVGLSSYSRLDVCGVESNVRKEDCHRVAVWTMHEANGDYSPPTVVILMEESWPMWAARSTTSRPRRLMRLGLVHGRHPGGIVAYVDSQSDGFLPSAARVG